MTVLANWFVLRNKEAAADYISLKPFLAN